MKQLKHKKLFDHTVNLNKRESAAKRGYDGRWRTARKQYLTLHPLCVDCEKEGRVVSAQVIDHIIPHKGDDELFWDQDNWQGLCRSHHSRKTAAQDGGFGNKIKTATGNHRFKGAAHKTPAKD